MPLESSLGGLTGLLRIPTSILLFMSLPFQVHDCQCLQQSQRPAHSLRTLGLGLSCNPRRKKRNNSQATAQRVPLLSYGMLQQQGTSRSRPPRQLRRHFVDRGLHGCHARLEDLRCKELHALLPFCGTVGKKGIWVRDDAGIVLSSPGTFFLSS